MSIQQTFQRFVTFNPHPQHTKLPVLAQVQQPLVGVGVMEPTNLEALFMEMQRFTPVGEQVLSAKIALLDAGDNRWRAMERM